MNYIDAMKYIEEKSKLGLVPGLDNVKELLRRLGNPEQKCKCLHIAGTNGKGSIFSFVQEILLEAGYTVGRYVSPTIMTYLERFQINKVNMSEERFAELLEIVSKEVDSMVNDGLNSPTSFEIETAIAFLYFSLEKTDYVLIECGMGGRLDATNVIETPIVSVFASISMDHMHFLGDTLEKIAVEKAGIIKAGGDCVSYEQNPIVAKVLKEKCNKKNARLFCVDEEDLYIKKTDLNGSEFVYKNQEYKISLLGEHQVSNAVTAIETVKLLDGISEADIYNGLRNTRWQGRLTKVKDEPLMYVDGAHNEDAWKILKKAVNKYFTNRRIIYIIGVLKDKEFKKMAELLADTMSVAITITPEGERGLDKEILADVLRECHVPCVKTASSSEEAIQIAMSHAKEEDVVLVCGSLSFISDYLRIGDNQ